MLSQTVTTLIDIIMYTLGISFCLLIAMIVIAFIIGTYRFFK